MQSNRARTLRAIIFALLIAVGGASPALAVETSSTTTEGVSVLATISMSGVPASISYGAVNAGDTPQSATQNIILSTSNPNGARLEVAASDLTGSGTIPSTARTFGGLGANDGGTLGGGAYPGPAGTRLLLFNRGVAFAGPITVSFNVTLAIPSNAVPGTYTGSLVFFAVTN